MHFKNLAVASGSCYSYIQYIVFIFLAVLLYDKYLTKNKIEKKQEDINTRDLKLVRLATENEWLLKEIHHRIKNNLQIIISLLNTQSTYIKNKDVLLAIQNSQHRIHAISLIHQKLYQTNNLSSIDISWYIFELVNYLKDSFNTDNKIKFELNTKAIQLDIEQAVPLGLILNEAVTNAIKYAFPYKDGIISIMFKEISDHEYILSIADNGIGFLPGFETRKNDSFGMNLMMGLAEQLDGSFKIVSESGVVVIIEFIKRETEI